MSKKNIKSKKDAVWLLVASIPRDLHSRDLRVFFSTFVERDLLQLFHYKRREFKLVDRANPDTTEQTKTNCCLVCLKSLAFAAQFTLYHGSKWTNFKGEPTSGECIIRRVKLGNFRSDPVSYCSKREKRLKSRGVVNECLADLPELNPPSDLPQGNVGTPSEELLLNAKRWPTNFLTRLGVGQRRRKQGQYSEVKGPAYQESYLLGFDGKWGSIEEKFTDRPENDDDLEEWDRYESLHPESEGPHYLTKSRRPTHSQLFEEEVEYTWDKGDATGLVFYTDDFYWDQQQDYRDSVSADELFLEDPMDGIEPRPLKSKRRRVKYGSGRFLQPEQKTCSDSKVQKNNNRFTQNAFDRDCLSEGQFAGDYMRKFGWTPEQSRGSVIDVTVRKSRAGLGFGMKQRNKGVKRKRNLPYIPTYRQILQSRDSAKRQSWGSQHLVPYGYETDTESENESDTIYVESSLVPDYPGFGEENGTQQPSMKHNLMVSYLDLKRRRTENTIGSYRIKDSDEDQ